jgi:hypothetical protein
MAAPLAKTKATQKNFAVMVTALASAAVLWRF